ncbi:sorbosone dehydrogenase family protein [Algoriphagus kandeliae]|uniref:Sorbosone dehydrogenase family protein n=1 Tax=Algoriphagus kandeliae TaxID=2562278 RepID=A0A4Y9QXZ1_9BACT|nr:PQQ-dependent sugar dehydrogenase [Algoriphagus kandeliae]TFV97341.1 sorbosone dehydrogenase family protein [Algoriphagus kandeliae]
MNYTKNISLAVCFGLLMVQASCQQNSRKLTEIKTPNSSNKRSIKDAQADVKLDRIKLPEGFEISVWAADIPNARSMALAENGVVFVGNRQENNVYAVVDEDADGKADTKFILAEGLRMPNGVAYKDGDLYVAEVSRILKFPDILNNLGNPKYEVVYDQYPTERHHGWKFIAFGPDGMLYVPVGAPCNICESEDEIFASITRIDVNSSNPKPEVYAHGVRNSVGFDWHPVTGNLWFTDNGRDMMGDDIPDCELNVATEAGQHFGYPYWHAGDVKDPEFGDKGESQDFYVAPAAKLGAHVAPLGIRFYEGGMFPSTYKNQAIIAKHGSWNRSKKSGYDVVLAKIDDTGKVSGVETFASGWLDDASQEVWGRPVDVQELPDGSLLISDDVANCIYRVTYTGN